jgi:ABC-type branched-subunit amino acid transport system substrate-binding protein
VQRLKAGGTRAQLVALSSADPEQTARALGASGAGLAMSQTVPPLARISLPVVGEYRAALADLSAVVQPAPRSLEAFIAAKVAVEAIRRAGATPTRDSLLAALEAMSSHDTGGFRVGYSRTQRQGSARIYLQAIDSDGVLLH